MFLPANLSITEPERIWLREVYDRCERREQIDPWKLQIELRDKLPKDFLPSQVRSIFFQFGSLTLLGIIAVAPASERIRDTERVIISIRDFLIKNPEKRDISALQMAELLHIDHTYAQELFGLMSSVAPFWTTASGVPSGIGLSSITIGNEQCLKELLAFESIEKSIAIRLEQYAQASRSPVELLGITSQITFPESASKPAPLQPDLDWYRDVSSRKAVPTRCPLANVHRCPRYYQSLSLLGNAGIMTKIQSEKDEDLLNYWKRNEHWPVLQEHATAISGSGDMKSSFHNFCPEVSFDTFRLFAVYLHRFADEIDRNIRHEQLEKQGTHVPNDWRWNWEFVEFMHYTDCPIYATLSAHVSERRATHENNEIVQLKPTIYGIGIDLKALWNKLWNRKTRPDD